MGTATDILSPLAVLLGRLVPAREPPVEVDAAHVWLEAHPHEVAKHRGRQIAVHPERGIVASAPTLADLLAEIDRLGDVTTLLRAGGERRLYVGGPVWMPLIRARLRRGVLSTVALDALVEGAA